MPPQGMDWQQAPHDGGQWREHQSYYESRQQPQPQPYGGGAPASSYPPPYPSSRPPFNNARRVTPNESYAGGGRGGYYDRGGWQERQPRHLSPQRSSPQRLPPVPYRMSEERPYMPLHDEMRSQDYPLPEGAAQPPPPPSVRIQFRPNRHRRHPSHPFHKSPPPTKSPRKEKSFVSSDGKQKEKGKKDKDALSLLAKVSFDMQASPSGSHGEVEDDEQQKPQDDKRTPQRNQQADNTSPADQRMPTASPLVAQNTKDVSPVSPECWTPKASNASPRHRRAESGAMRTPHGHAPMITPASSVPGMTPRHHRRHSSGVDSLYHQRWTNFAEEPVTPGARSPYTFPAPPGPTPEHSRDYLTMEHIATPPQAGGSPTRMHHGAQPSHYYQQAPFREQQGWDRGGPPPPPPPQSDPSGWRSRDGYGQQRYPEEYPPVVGRAPSYEEEGPPPLRYPRYPPPEAYAEGQGGHGGDYHAWRDHHQQYEGQGAYQAPYSQVRRHGQYSSPPRHRSYPQHQQPPPYSQEHQATQHALTPQSHDVPYQHPHQSQDPSYAAAPYTYVQQPRLEEKTMLRKKFSWKHYPELERFLVSHRDEYLRHSALNYTAEQKQYNNWLTERLLEVAAQHNYEFDPEEFNFVAVRDRIRCYYKSFVQTARKRGISFPGLKSPTKKARTDAEGGAGADVTESVDPTHRDSEAPSQVTRSDDGEEAAPVPESLEEKTAKTNYDDIGESQTGNAEDDSNKAEGGDDQHEDADNHGV